MDQDSARQTVARINSHLRGMPWCDFEIMEYHGNRLVLMGSIDPSSSHDIEVTFVDVAFLSLPTEWRTNTSEAPLSIVVGEDAVPTNRRFRVVRGTHIFRFQPEDMPDCGGCLIGARAIEFSVKE